MKNNKVLTILVSLIIIFSVIGLIAFIISSSYAVPLENDVEVELNTDLIYYLNIKYDGVDKDGVESSDSVTASITSGYITVTDKIPDGLTFDHFVTTSDGTIGAVQRSDSTKSCRGNVVDDTNDPSTTEGRWNSTNTEFTYHGLHYDKANNTVSFKVKNLRAGCVLTVGIVTKTPASVDDRNTTVVEKRRDFYNFANASEKYLSKNSNTVHAYMGSADEQVYNVRYEYTGTVPVGAPAVPQLATYAKDSSVGIAAFPLLEGYTFSGWTTTDATISNGSFTMPASEVTLRGSFTKINDYTVTYVINGESPEGYVVPTVKKYYQGATVSVDSLKNGDVFEGYRFSGWTTTDITVSSDGDFEMPSKNVTLTGSWEQIKYTVTYRFYDTILPPNSDSLLPTTKEYLPGTTVTLEDITEPSGYKFLGWYKEDTFAMPEEDVIIYGEWQRILGEFEPTIVKEIVNPKDAYHIGDTINFKTTVTNTASFAIKDVIVKEVTEDAKFISGTGYTVNSDHFATISSLAAGSSVILNSTYTVTNDNSSNSQNVVQIIGALADNDYVLKDKEYKATEDFVIDKTFEPQIKKEIINVKDKYYVGDTIEFRITITNTVAFPIKDVKVKELTTGAKFKTGTGYTLESDTVAIIPSLGANQSITLSSNYTVTNENVNNKQNVVQITEASADNGCLLKPGEYKATVNFEAVNFFAPTITKQIIDKKSIYYVGDTIEFKITITNPENITINNVKVNELTTGAIFKAGTGYTVDSDTTVTIPTIEANESVEIYSSYLVTKQNVSNRSNTVQITEASADNEYELKPGEYKSTVYFSTGDVFEPQITKEIVDAKDKYYVGDTIEFRITVTNPETFTIRNIKVKELTEGAKFKTGTGYTLQSDTVAQISSLGANKSITLYSSYTVTEENINVNQNVVEITEATVSGYKLLDKEYKATADFVVNSILKICKNVTGGDDDNAFQFLLKNESSSFETWFVLKNGDCKSYPVQRGTYKIKEVVPQEYTLKSVTGISENNGELIVENGHMYNVTFTNQFVRKKYMHSTGRVVNKIVPVTDFAKNYTRVEYIESTGSQWINTGLRASATHTIYADGFERVNKTGQIIHAYGNNNSRLGHTIYGGTKYSAYYWIVNGSGRSRVENKTFVDDGFDLTQRFQVTQNSSGITFVQNGLEKSITYSGATTGTLNKNWYIFKTDASGQGNTVGVFYEGKITENGVVLRDFVPCYRKSDGVIGVYDLENEVFYTNAGTGTFVKGPDVQGGS